MSDRPADTHAAPEFQAALAAIRNGAPCSLRGLSLTVNGIVMRITEEQFDLAWAAMGEEIDDDEVISLG